MIKDFAIAFCLGALCGAPAFGILGFWLRAHIGSVASGVARATTLPGHVVDQVNTVVPGLGSALQTAALAGTAPVVAIVAKVADASVKAAG